MTPIYIPSRGRALTGRTAPLLMEAGIPFRLVVEPHEVHKYLVRFGAARVLMLPESHRGIAYARNFIKRHATAAGAERHWQLDDNISGFKQRIGERELTAISPSGALGSMETFVAAYQNIGVAGPRHVNWSFARPFAPGAVRLNQQCYSAVNVANSMPFFWREDVVEDTDFSLQVLTAGLCTVLFPNVVMMKAATGAIPGGNTDIHAAGGKATRQVLLAQRWPGLVKLAVRADGTPRLLTGHIWRTFDQQLICRLQ